MEVWIESLLLEGRQGETIRKAALSCGWVAGTNESFLSGEELGRLSLFSIPCARGNGYVTAVSDGINLPESSIQDEKALLEGYDDPVFCPEGTTLIAGEMLQQPEESEAELFARILSYWDWWMDLRASSRELAVSWGGTPNRDLLNLLNRLDAGFLDQSPQHALAAGKIARLVGFHPATTLLAASAEIPVLGPEKNNYATRLLSTWTLGREVFWASLKSADNLIAR